MTQCPTSSSILCCCTYFSSIVLVFLQRCFPQASCTNLPTSSFCYMTSKVVWGAIHADNDDTHLCFLIEFSHMTLPGSFRSLQDDCTAHFITLLAMSLEVAQLWHHCTMRWFCFPLHRRYSRSSKWRNTSYVANKHMRVNDCKSRENRWHSSLSRVPGALLTGT